MKIRISEFKIVNFKDKQTMDNIQDINNELTNNISPEPDEELVSIAALLKDRNFSFKQGFSAEVMKKIRVASSLSDQNYFKYFTIQLSNLFRWVAPIGSIIILLLMITLYLTQGSLSLSCITGIEKLSLNDIIALSFYN